MHTNGNNQTFSSNKNGRMNVHDNKNASNLNPGVQKQGWIQRQGNNFPCNTPVTDVIVVQNGPKIQSERQKGNRESLIITHRFLHTLLC